MAEETHKAPPICSQCDRVAVMELNGALLCVDCEYKFQQSRWMVFAQNAAMMNHADAHMCASVGMPHLRNPIEIPKAPVPPIHFSNQHVSVSGGTVGSINLGNVQDIQVRIKQLAQQGEATIAHHLAELTNAVLDSSEASQDLKNELLEHVSFLAGQASAKPEERKAGPIKAVISAIKDGASAVGSIATAWTSVKPIVDGYFGLGSAP